MDIVQGLMAHTTKLIDLSADFRLEDEEEYRTWYSTKHTSPSLIGDFVYGLPELYRSELQASDYIASPGCIATSAIISLYHIIQKLEERVTGVVIDSKVGSSAFGASPSRGSHHPERRSVVRNYFPTGHRHTAEMEMALGCRVSFSPHAVELVRGIATTSHVLCTKLPSKEQV